MCKLFASVLKLGITRERFCVYSWSQESSKKHVKFAAIMLLAFKSFCFLISPHLSFNCFPVPNKGSHLNLNVFSVAFQILFSFMCWDVSNFA